MLLTYQFISLKRYHFVSEKVVIGSLQVSHVSTHNQLVDILNKPLPKSRFTLFQSKIGVFYGSTILQGHIKREPISPTN